MESIEPRIRSIRGRRVLLDSDLAELYGVATKQLNQQVRRNRARFPDDFVFRLTAGEAADSRSQIVTSSAGHGGRRYPLRAFTEQGVAMLSSVLNSPRAIVVNVEIMRAFVRLQRLQGEHADLEAKYDERFRTVLDAIRQVMRPEPAPARHPVGFRPRPRGPRGAPRDR